MKAYKRVKKLFKSIVKKRHQFELILLIFFVVVGILLIAASRTIWSYDNIKHPESSMYPTASNH